MNRLTDILVTILIICCSFHLIKSCYITNCPWGGKRSIESLPKLENAHSVILIYFSLIKSSLNFI